MSGTVLPRCQHANKPRAAPWQALALGLDHRNRRRAVALNFRRQALRRKKKNRGRATTEQEHTGGAKTRYMNGLGRNSLFGLARVLLLINL